MFTLYLCTDIFIPCYDPCVIGKVFRWWVNSSVLLRIVANWKIITNFIIIVQVSSVLYNNKPAPYLICTRNNVSVAVMVLMSFQFARKKGKLSTWTLIGYCYIENKLHRILIPEHFFDLNNIALNYWKYILNTPRESWRLPIFFYSVVQQVFKL